MNWATSLNFLAWPGQNSVADEASTVRTLERCVRRVLTLPRDATPGLIVDRESRNNLPLSERKGEAILWAVKP
jgi:hypothetical protein